LQSAIDEIVVRIMLVRLLELLQPSEQIHRHILLVAIILVYFAKLLVDLNLVDGYWIVYYHLEILLVQMK
jgi:hypothetical protein